ncbi:hypothetical protein CTI12_AA410690 [Artemisia annua]|uniref:Uncharacterized protein n=1 Tax=Artemisia annua TaxID=35608 RepID=A0A2U1M7U9_ARTAN|nr:hypothetical protein CTI12_AA410690 [Artemisia annua]
METQYRHKSNNSGDNFTFQTMSPDIQMDFELADHLFSNGKFLLHTFPVQTKSLRSCTFPRSYSVSSKDSLVSSRSNSTNSRSSSSSSCSSARTSTSEASTPRVAMKTTIFPEKGSWSPVHYSNNYQLPAQRWQFMAPVPVLNRRTSQKRKGEDEKRKGSPKNKICNKKKGFCQRFFRWLASSCKECHAMEPSKKAF